MLPKRPRILSRLALRAPLEVARGVEFHMVAGSRHSDCAFAGTEKELELSIALNDGVWMVMSVIQVEFVPSPPIQVQYGCRNRPFAFAFAEAAYRVLSSIRQSHIDTGIVELLVAELAHIA
jgi:hypothetical protein